MKNNNLIHIKTNYRISKDTSKQELAMISATQSYQILLKKLKDSSDWPPLFAAYTHAVLSKKHEINYKQINTINDLTDEEINKTDIFIIVSSIVCSETEIEIIKKLNQLKKITIAIGPFATNLTKIYFNAGANVIKGEPELYFLIKI